MQLVVHSPDGSRVNRAWGLALCKRVCTKFNFELQAAATEDNIVLSLTTAHSFDLAEVRTYLHPATVREVLVQALLDAPMFMTRWRWVAGIALALPRFRGGRKVPPPLARMDAEDLIAAIFPDQLACAENLAGAREIPDHPLIRQTIADCLGEVMDISGLERLLTRIRAGEVTIVARDLTEPSPLALEVLSARPYAYLDDAPLEERRTQAVMGRRWIAPDDAAELGRLDPDAIARVREEAWPAAANRDELHDGLASVGFLSTAEAAAAPGWREWLAELARERRATLLRIPHSAVPAKADAHPDARAVFGTGPGCRPDAGSEIWVAAERLPQFMAIWPEARLVPPVTAPAPYADRLWSTQDALVEILRSRLEGLGPVRERELAAPLGLAPGEIGGALAALQSEGFALRGRFTPGAEADEWCERRLLARIHRYTLKRLRAEIEPVAARDFLRFLFAWQRVTDETRMEGPDALAAVLGQLEGFEAPAGAWETEILPARVADYDPAWLDDQCLAGRIAWARLRPRSVRPDSGDRPGTGAAGPVRTTPIALLARRHAPLWASLSPLPEAEQASSHARAVAGFIRENGASFFDELAEGTRLLRPQAEDALAELVALGLVTSDSFAGLRALLMPADRKRRSRRGRALFGMEDSGRWALARRPRAAAAPAHADDIVEHLARTLLRRYGVVFWRMLDREAAWLPPWRDLLRVYRRLEARGEIRGGRFVAGFSGEQFALPEAIGPLREVRRKPGSGEWVSLSGADPLNLVGILTPGPKLGALTGNRVLYRDGIPVALLAGGEMRFLEELDEAAQWQARKMLVRGAIPAGLAALA
jgi:ATP-dependent Lhr-like helicase